MKEPVLKPCPFCGQRPVLQRDVRYPRPECKRKDAFEVVCKNLNCIIGYVDERYSLSEEEAIEWWNRRASNENA